MRSRHKRPCGGWVNRSGPTKPAHYPAWLEVDWVRVYQRSE